MVYYKKEKKGLRIPEAPKVEEPIRIRREDVKIRKSWTRSPVEQVVPNKKKDRQESKFSNKGNLRKRVEQELNDYEEEE